MSDVFQDQANEEQAFEEVENQEENASTEESVRAKGSSPTKPETPEEQMARIKKEVMERLYKHDPYIREGIQTQLAVEEARGPTPTKESNVVFDENGRVIGTKVGPMSGGNAEELMRKIRESYNKTKGEES